MNEKIEVEETKKDLRREIKRLKRDRNIERGVVVVIGIAMAVILKKFNDARLAAEFELGDARDIIVDMTSEIRWFKDQMHWIDD